MNLSMSGRGRCWLISLSLVAATSYGSLAMAQGKSANANAREKSAELIDHSKPCHPAKDTCGRLTKRQRDMQLALCDVLVRRGTSDTKAELTRKLKGKSCAQHYSGLSVVE
ncbi:MAG: hypothetical protein AAF542_19275 [Pseudomonadota bacterium]